MLAGSDSVLASDESNNIELENNRERKQTVASHEVIKLNLVEKSRAIESCGVGRINCLRANHRSQLWTFIVYRHLALEAWRRP
jgi:hypothetical protein